MTTQILFLKKAPSVRVVFCYAISGNSEVVIYPCVFRDGKEKEQKTKDKARMDEVNRSEFLQHLLIQGDVMSRSEIMGQIGEIARKIMDIEDDNYSFFESAGMRYSFPITGKSDSPLSSDMHAADGNRDKHTRETMQLPPQNAMDELPSNILTTGEKSRSRLTNSAKKRSVKKPKTVIAKLDSGPFIDANSPGSFQDQSFLAGLYSSPLDFGAKEFKVA